MESPDPAPSLPFPRQGRLGGVDHGEKRIGLSVCDLTQQFASPLRTYERRTRPLDADFFRKIAKDETLVGWVVGLPLHANGDEGAKAIEARKFADWLSKETNLPFVMHDERYSTVFADEAMQLAGLTKRKQKQNRDQIAAQAILASFLDRRERDAPSGGEATS